MKTILLLSVPFVAAMSMLAAFAFWRRRKPSPLFIRLRDRAIFMRSEAPCRENPPLFVRLQWVQRSWWPGGMLVPTGETWSCDDDSEYEVVARHYVEEGCKIMAKW